MPHAAQSISVDDIPPKKSDFGVWRPVRLHFGITSLGVNAWGAREEGELVIERHTETEDSGSRHEELYFVARGRATFVVDGETLDAPAGTFVYVPDPDSVREARAEEADTLILIVGGTPGEPFAPSPWETEPE